MSRNIEIKAHIDDLAAVRERVRRLPARSAHSLDQTDTFFNVPRGRLKLREFGDGRAELIAYERADEIDAKLCRYERIPCPAPAALRRAFGDVLGIRGVVRKHREVFLVGSTRIHLDTVEGLGTFLELEVVLTASEGEGPRDHSASAPADAGRTGPRTAPANADSIASGKATADELLRALDVPRSSLVAGAYIDLLEARRATDCSAPAPEGR